MAWTYKPMMPIQASNTMLHWVHKSATSCPMERVQTATKP
jgi:hypothetical protein